MTTEERNSVGGGYEERIDDMVHVDNERGRMHRESDANSTTSNGELNERKVGGG